LAAELHELTTHRPDRLAIVFPEIGNRLEVGREPPDQPHQLDIALRFAFQPPARLQAVEIAVEVDLQQRRGMVGRPARRRRRHPGKPQGCEVQFRDEDLDRPNRVLLADIILQAVRQQRLLHPIFAIDEPMHRQAPQSPKLRDSKTAAREKESIATAISRSFHTPNLSCRSLRAGPVGINSDFICGRRIGRRCLRIFRVRTARDWEEPAA